MHLFTMLYVDFSSVRRTSGFPDTPDPDSTLRIRTCFARIPSPKRLKSARAIRQIGCALATSQAAPARRFPFLRSRRADPIFYPEITKVAMSFHRFLPTVLILAFAACRSTTPQMLESGVSDTQKTAIQSAGPPSPEAPPAATATPEAAPASPPVEEDPVLVTFDGGAVRQSDFEAYLDYRTSFSGQGGRSDPADVLREDPALVRPILYQIAFNKVARRTVEESNLDTQGILDSICAREVHAAAWNEYMRTTMYPEKVAPARAEFDRKMRDYYDKHREEFVKTPSQAVFRMIFFDAFGTSETVRSEKEALARRVRAQLDAAPDRFVELARTYSDAEASIRGEELGPYDPSNLNPVLAEALETLEPGEISPVIENPKGFFLLRLDRRTPPELKSFEEMKSFIFATLGGFYTYDIVSAYMKDLIGEPEPVFFLDRLSTDTAARETVVARLGDTGLTNDDVYFMLGFLIDARTNDPNEAEQELRPVLEKKAIYKALKARGVLDSERWERIAEICRDAHYGKFLEAMAMRRELPEALGGADVDNLELVPRLFEKYHVRIANAEPRLPDD